MKAVDLLELTRGRADAIALVAPERTWSYAELDGAVTTRARALRESGVDAGMAVPVTVHPDPRGMIELLALWRVGATVVPLNPRLTEFERAAANAALRDAPSSAQAILWTSGTEGRPRGVAIGFEALMASATGAEPRLGLASDDVWLASLSPAHVGGLALITRAILLGSTLVSVGPFDAAGAWACIGGLRVANGPGVHVTHLSVVPTQLLRLLEASGDRPPPASFRCALVGGAGTPRELLERAHAAKWPIALTYGLTEATSQVATSPPELTRRKPGTVGKPLTATEIRLAPDGEILVRGKTLASGYIGEGVAPLVDSAGWHHTGDLGRVDEDGDLWVIGRRADRIVSGGVTVDAVEVEEALRAHPQVADACVVGVPDLEWGERVAAWVEPAAEPVDLAALDGHVRARLSAAKVPRRYHVGGAIPRNANGKVDRQAVRAALASAKGSPDLE
ncbi:MAG: AMP-binding protein [Longimicrobiales bacterium]